MPNTDDDALKQARFKLTTLQIEEGELGTFEYLRLVYATPQKCRRQRTRTPHPKVQIMKHKHKRNERIIWF
jgi:hypothetical protein